MERRAATGSVACDRAKCLYRWLEAEIFSIPSPGLSPWNHRVVSLQQCQNSYAVCKMPVLVCVSTTSRKTAGMPPCCAQCPEAQRLNESQSSVCLPPVESCIEGDWNLTFKAQSSHFNISFITILTPALDKLLKDSELLLTHRHWGPFL